MSTYEKPYTYRQCVKVGCLYEIPSGTPYDEWIPLAMVHVKEDHGKSDAEAINDIWLRLLGIH